MDILLRELNNQIPEINNFFKQYENEIMPIYSSIDIRDSGYKCCVVDTNLFPSGFNNISPSMFDRTAFLLSSAINNRINAVKTICLIIENHTRNSFYIQHVSALYTILKKANYNVYVATFNSEIPENGLEFEVRGSDTIILYDLNFILDKINFDLIFLNHDLSLGVPPIIKKLSVPTLPSFYLGWHSRLKSQHFSFLDKSIKSFASTFNFDDWLLQPYFTAVPDINIDNEDDRQRLYEASKILFNKIQEKYDAYNISDKPFIFIKNDTGTYGMGVQAIESPNSFLQLNRKTRNKLSSGKYQKSVNKFILQEGVSSNITKNNLVSEICYYQVETNFIGSFFRSNLLKSKRDNLNSKGMNFSKIPSKNPSSYERGISIDLNVIKDHNPNYLLYSILARLACIAACKEQNQLINLSETQVFNA